MNSLRKKLLKLFDKHPQKIISVIGVFLFAYILRIYFLKDNALSFAFDQGRDAFVAGDIINGDFKILGPSVSGIPGLYHGVLYYYLLAIGYVLGQGNPLGVAYLLSFVNSLTVFIVFGFTFLITKKYLPSILSAIIFAFSFEATQYANLLTNVSMAIWFVPLTYLGLYLWITKSSKWGSILCGLCLGLSIQSEVALGYHFVPIIFWILYYRKNIVKYDLLKFILFFSISVLTMVISEIKFGFMGIRGLLYLFTFQDEIAKNMNIGQLITVYLNQIGNTFAYNIFPVNITVGGFIGLLIVLVSLKIKTHINKNHFLWNYFLLSYILAHIFALPFGGSNMRHIMVGASAGICVITGILIWTYLAKTKILINVILTLVIISNLFKISTENKEGQTIFPLQKDLVLSKELLVLDYTYKESVGEDFSISTLTSPLYINTLWSYLYNWYGLQKYGYLPSWTGKDQIGSLGNNLGKPDMDVKFHFYIIEPTYGIPQQYVVYGQGEEDSMSSLVEEKWFGDLKVQKRIHKS